MNKKKMSKRQRDIKSKLMAAICMLLVSSIMMVSTTYAWFTLSTAPEVTGITTAVGANGNLEIALIPEEADLTRLDDPNVITSAVGDSSAATGTTIDEANVTWGNLVDVSDTDYYGMDKIMLYPAALNTEATADGTAIKSAPLKVPVYGADGRVSELDDKKTITGLYNGENEKFEESGDTTKFGVRAIGTASSLSNSELAYRNAKTAASSAASSARTAAARSLTSNGNTLAAMAIAYGANKQETGYTLEQIKSLSDVVTTLNSAVTQIEQAMLQFIVAESIAPAAVNDDNYEAIVTAITASNVAALAANPTSVHADVKLPAGISADSAAVTKLAEMKANVATAKETMDDLVTANKSSYDWSEFSSAINAVMDTDGLTLNDYEIGELLTNDDAVTNIIAAALGEGLKLQMGSGSGIYADIAEFCGNYTASIKLDQFEVKGIKTPEGMPATMMTTVTGTPHLTTIQTGLSGFVGSDGATGAKAITTYYGYIVDLAFRTNAASSNLLLQTEAIDRVYSDNTANEATMGHGASMSFYSLDETTFKPAQVQSLMGALRIVFFDPATGTIINEARLDPATAETVEKTLDDASKVNEITMDLVMWDTTANAPKVGADGKADAVITALDQNKAKAISVLVYLDGEKITNADVAAENAMSMTGSMNLQFSSSAELMPMEYSDLRTGNAPAAGTEDEDLVITGVDGSIATGNAAYTKGVLIVELKDVAEGADVTVTVDDQTYEGKAATLDGKLGVAVTVSGVTADSEISVEPKV